MRSLGYLTLFAVGTSCSAIAHAQADTEAGDRIVVTGSRIVRDGSQMPTPVTVVTTEALTESAPSNIPDGLNKLPQFSGSENQRSGATFQAGTTDTGNKLNLRGLGTERLLVMLNGQRVPPTGRTNAVDVNMLPQLLVERVDVVTGGASAVYGSDAVSGVVNFVLDNDFTGFKGVAQTGISDKGDAFSYRLGGAVGFNLGDSIHFMGSFDHYSDDGVDSLFAREWAHDYPGCTGSGNTANPTDCFYNSRYAHISDGGMWVRDPATYTSNLERDYLVFLPDGSVRPYDHGLPTNNSGYQIGGDAVEFGNGDPYPTVPLTAPLKTDQAFARLTVDLADSVRFFAQGIYGASEIDTITAPANSRWTTTNRRVYIYADNPYLNPDVAQRIMDEAPVITDIDGSDTQRIILSRMWNDAPTMRQMVETDTVMGQVGLEGEFGSSWAWNVNYVHGEANYRVSAYEPNSLRFFAALDAVLDEDPDSPTFGKIVCGVTVRNPGYLDDCVPMNVLGEGNVSQSAGQYVWGWSTFNVNNVMDYVNVGVSGDLFDLPAGPVSVAFGAEYRTQSIEQTTNSDPTAFNPENPNYIPRDDYYEGVRGYAPGGGLWLVTNQGTASGEQTVKEAYAELAIPILSDTPGALALDLDLAGRVTDYETSGRVETYKIGLNWMPVDAFRIRANYSRDIKAPSLYDLFAGDAVSQGGFLDPQTDQANGGQQAVINIITGGNPFLEPEIATTTTLGFVAQPVLGLTFSVDAYRIEIDGAIQGTSVANIVDACFESGGTSPQCALINRPNSVTGTEISNYPISVRVGPVNVAALETQGIDAELTYRTAIDNLIPALDGTLTFRAFLNYLDKFEVQQSASEPMVDFAGYNNVFTESGLPKLKAMLQQSYTGDRFSISFTERFTGNYDSTARVSGNQAQVYTSPQWYENPNRIYVDANFTFDVIPGSQLFVNVQNLFDTTPPNNGGSAAMHLSAPTDKRFYEVVGRYFTAGLRAEF